MKSFAMWMLAGLAGGVLLAASPVWADRACERGCEDDAKQCKVICKKHAKGMAGKCEASCNEEKRACVEECSGRPGNREKLDEGDDDHGH